MGVSEKAASRKIKGYIRIAGSGFCEILIRESIGISLSNSHMSPGLNLQYILNGSPPNTYIVPYRSPQPKLSP